MLSFYHPSAEPVLVPVADALRIAGARPDFTWPIETPETPGRYRLRIASDYATRDRAYRLAADVYSAHGYIAGGRGRLVWPYDADPTTITLLVETAAGEAVATATLAYASTSTLPAERLFPDELSSLRARGRRLVEVCRLCIADAHRGQRAILTRLVNALFVHAARIGEASEAVIEVHPCRARWYQRNLRFEQLGPERPCASVGGQPTVLLRCDLAHYHRREFEPSAEGGHDSGDGQLYRDFHPWFEEALLAEAMARYASPMSPEEAAAFGIPHPACERSAAG